MSKEIDRVTRCTRCFGRDVRPSKHRGLLDNVMWKLHRAPFRCRGCQNRFYVYIPREKDEEEETADTVETGTGQPGAGAVHIPDAAKPAEP